MRKLLMLLFVMLMSSQSDADISKTYDQTLIVSTFIFRGETISSGDDYDAPPTTYWLYFGLKEGFEATFYCDTDWQLCDKVDGELYRTLRDNSKQLKVTTTETFRTPATENSIAKRCNYHYHHTTKLDSGRAIELNEPGPSYLCAAPGKELKCPSAKYALFDHPSGWRYCVWVGFN